MNLEHLDESKPGDAQACNRITALSSSIVSLLEGYTHEECLTALEAAFGIFIANGYNDPLHVLDDAYDRLLDAIESGEFTRDEDAEVDDPKITEG